MYWFKRVLMTVPLLLAISFISFVLMRLAPGGPFDRERAPASPEIERQLRLKYHLDEPVWKQYSRFLSDLAHGDLGVSLKYRNHSVNDIISQGLPVSLALGTLSFGVALGVGIPMGFWSAARRGRWYGALLGLAAILLVCIPGFVLGPVLILWFGIAWRIFPVGLWGSPLHAVLPTAALGLYYSGRIARLFEEGMRDTMAAPFIAAARAKGMTETSLLVRHAGRVAIVPVVSYCGPLLADLLAGAFVIENIFQIPGLGTFLVNGSLNRDYTLVMGLVMLYAVLILGLNLLVDLSYRWLDPRVIYE